MQRIGYSQLTLRLQHQTLLFYHVKCSKHPTEHIFAWQVVLLLLLDAHSGTYLVYWLKF
jgi:hypothetical protein